MNLLSGYPGLLEIMLQMESSEPANEFINRLRIVLSNLELNDEHFNSALCLLADYLHGVALAIQCDSKNKLSINKIDRPLLLFVKAIE